MTTRKTTPPTGRSKLPVHRSSTRNKAARVSFPPLHRSTAGWFVRYYVGHDVMQADIKVMYSPLSKYFAQKRSAESALARISVRHPKAKLIRVALDPRKFPDPKIARARTRAARNAEVRT